MSKTLLEELKTTVKKATRSMREEVNDNFSSGGSLRSLYRDLSLVVKDWASWDVSPEGPGMGGIAISREGGTINLRANSYDADETIEIAITEGDSGQVHVVDGTGGGTKGSLDTGDYHPEEVLGWFKRLYKTYRGNIGESSDDSEDGVDNGEGESQDGDDEGPSSVEDLVDSYKDKLSDKGIEVSATGNTLTVSVQDEDSKDDEDLKALLDQFHDGAWQETDDGLTATFTYGAESEALQETATTKDIEGSYFKWIEGPNKNSKDFEEHWKSFIQGMAYKLDPKTVDAAKPGAAKLYKANMGSSGAAPGFKKSKDTF